MNVKVWKKWKVWKKINVTELWKQTWQRSCCCCFWRVITLMHFLCRQRRVPGALCVVIRGVSVMSRCDNRAPNSQECFHGPQVLIHRVCFICGITFGKLPVVALREALQQSLIHTQTPGTCLLLYCTPTSEVQILLGSDGQQWFSITCFISALLHFVSLFFTIIKASPSFVY